MNTPTPREVEMPLLGRAMGYAAGLKDCHDCFADRAAIVLYDALTAAREELKAVTEQRDAALKQTIYCNADRIAKIRTEDNLAKVTEQRDRLAEALNKMISICSCKTEDIDTVNEIRDFVDTITKHSNP